MFYKERQTILYTELILLFLCLVVEGLSSRDHMVVGFIITYAISTYRHYWIYNYLCNQYLSPLTMWDRTLLRRGVLDTTLCDKVCQWLAAGQWFSPGTLVSSINKTYRHDITEILLKVALKHHNPYPLVVEFYWINVYYLTLSVSFKQLLLLPNTDCLQ